MGRHSDHIMPTGNGDPEITDVLTKKNAPTKSVGKKLGVKQKQKKTLSQSNATRVHRYARARAKSLLPLCVLVSACLLNTPNTHPHLLFKSQLSFFSRFLPVLGSVRRSAQTHLGIFDERLGFAPPSCGTASARPNLSRPASLPTPGDETRRAGKEHVRRGKHNREKTRPGKNYCISDGDRHTTIGLRSEVQTFLYPFLPSIQSSSSP